MPTNFKAHLALSAVALFYGLNYTVAKDVMGKGYMTPFGFIALRVIAGAILFFLFHYFFIREKMEKKDILYAALCSIFGVSTNMLCFFEGLKNTSPIHASLLMVLTPVLVLIMSAFIIKEKITINKAVGVLLGLMGAFILVSQASKTGSQVASLYGDMMILFNATSYAIYLVLVRRLIKKYNPLTVIKWVFFFGLFVVLPFGAKDLLATDWATFTPRIYGGVLFVLICATFLAYLLNAYALSKVMPSTVGFYIYFQPLIASTASVLIGLEKISIAMIIAAILLFLGVFLINRKRVQKA